jgi:hypothetical protein
LAMPINSSVCPALSCTSFKISGLILGSLSHFQLILVQGERHGSSSSVLQADSYFSQQHLFTPLYVFCAFIKNQVGIAAWVHIWVFSSVPLVFISVFVPVPCWGFFVLVLVLLWLCSIVWSQIL